MIKQWNVRNYSQQLTLLLIALLLFATWALTGFGKITAGEVPGWFTERFGNTFLMSFPGPWLSFYSIAFFETLAAVLALISILRLEFMGSRPAHFLKASLVGSMLCFLQLGFGQRLIAGHDDAAKLFFYFTGTAVLLLVVDHLKKDLHS